MIKFEDKKIHFPLKYKAHDHQVEALQFLKKSIQTGKKFIMLNLPTGVGKSYLAAPMFSNWYLNYINKDAKFDIITNSKILQNQYTKDFSFINDVKGKSNYYCQPYDCQCDTGKELCSIMKNTKCESCPYDNARNAWSNGKIGLTNFHLFNTLALFQEKIINDKNANVLIVDECQTFEHIFSDLLSTNISARILKNCGIGQFDIQKYDNRYISKIKDIEKYMEFLDQKLIPLFESKLAKYEEELAVNMKSQKKLTVTNFVKNLKSKLVSFENLFKSYKVDPNNLVLDINKNRSEKTYSGVELITQHVFVYDYLNEFVWKKYDHIIFMSATILSKELFSFINGLDPKFSEYLAMDSPFPLKNRPIFYMKIGKMNYTQKNETFKKQIPWINKILKKYEGKKGIIHTSNYEFAEWIRDNINDKRLLFHNTEDRNDILEIHLNSLEPTVLVSPSMMEGISLDDDLARFQIILKVPYPSLASNKIKLRKSIRPDWYSWMACVQMIQAAGRGVRSKTDYCDTYILDSNFSDLLKYNSSILPKYFTDAIKIVKV